MQKITPFFWFDSQAEEAANFYTSLIKDSKVKTVTRYSDQGTEIHGMEAGKVMTIDFDLAGQSFTALNGGAHFSFNPSISFFVVCETENEIDTLWKKLSKDGAALFELGKYDWSEKYGWVRDKFGLTWQLSLGKFSDVGQKITPSLLFVNDMFGKAEEAVHLYNSVFKQSVVEGILKYGPGEEGPAGMVKHAQFRLNGETFMVMDGPGKHDFEFNEAISFVVNCSDAGEVDYYWDKLTADGGEESMCGWLKDKFGVSWQVVPVEFIKMLQDQDPEKVKRVTAAMLEMKKLDLKKLREAYEGNSEKMTVNQKS